MIGAYILAFLTAVVAIATILSFAHISHGFVRVFSFPRLQFLVLIAALLAAVLVFVGDTAWEATLLVALIACFIGHATAVAQFLPVRASQSDVYDGPPDQPNMISVVACNVKMSNTRFKDALAMVRGADPDIAIFMETDKKWDRALEPLGETYPHAIREPLDNSYGIILYSRLDLVEAKIHHLVMEDTPSIEATVRLRDGQDVKLYAVHPEPPVPYADSAGRDAELIRVARLVTEDRLPAIVCGDLNDVAWSHTTRLFQRISRLLDPRVGRGFYNTFDARYWFLRWPLDHLFHDARFALVEMDRLPHIGSDHFPIYFKLALTKGVGQSRHPEKHDADDRETAADIHEEAEDLDRRAIGVDWEK